LEAFSLLLLFALLSLIPYRFDIHLAPFLTLSIDFIARHRELVGSERVVPASVCRRLLGADFEARYAALRE
jgi:hypothetical protein